MSAIAQMSDLRGGSDVASLLLKHNFDVGALRPYIVGNGRDERSLMTVNGAEIDPKTGGKKKEVIVANVDATLRKEEWIQLDRVVVAAARARLRAVAALRAAGLTFLIPDGMGKTILQTEKQSDAGSAVMSMDGMRESLGDRPVYALDSLPLPITHADFHFSARQLAVSRSGGSPLDTTMAEMAGRKVAELIEQTTLGVSPATTYTFGGGTIYGFTNFTDRNTKAITAPTASGWTPKTLVTEVLAMRRQAQADHHYGPYTLFVSSDWDQYLDADYSDAKGDNTLRQRLQLIEGIQAVTTLDYLTGWATILVQMTQDVVRLVVGMEITVVQWPSKGGMQQNFKVMAIQVPQIRSEYTGKCGLVHGS